MSRNDETYDVPDLDVGFMRAGTQYGMEGVVPDGHFGLILASMSHVTVVVGTEAELNGLVHIIEEALSEARSVSSPKEWAGDSFEYPDGF